MKMKMKNEIWKDILGYEDKYQISNIGSVKSLERKDSIGRIINERILKPYKENHGYLSVTLCDGKRQKYQIHILMAIMFLNHVSNGHTLVVDHINNNPLDNRVENLQIISQRKNLSKDKINGISKCTGVSKRRNVYSSCIEVDGKNIHLGTFKTEEEASLYYKESLLAIQNNMKINTNVNISSKYKGVSFNKALQKYQSYVTINGVKKHLGTFKTEAEANLTVIKYEK